MINSSSVEIIWTNFGKIERMFPNNFWKVLGMLKKKNWGKNLNFDGISRLFHGNCDKISQTMLDNIKTSFWNAQKKCLSKGFYRN